MIYVFKTSVKNQKDILQLRPFLNNLLKQSKWNFYLEDSDKILRVDVSADIVKAETVIKLLRSKGFNCEELSE